MLEGLELPTRERPCKVRDLIATLEPKDQEILKKALANPDWPHLTLANELKSRGLDISESPIRSHRQGRCSCA